jgi:hypothetical protein
LLAGNRERIIRQSTKETAMEALEKPKESLRGAERIQELSEKFPQVPRSIILKNDVLREGTRYTDDLREAGSYACPHFLVWNPEHAWNPSVGGKENSEVIAIPWKFDFADRTPVVVRYDPASPYKICRGEDRRYFLYRDGEPIEEVFFEESPRWIWENNSDGTMMGSIFMSWTREAVLGCALRYCEYSKTGDQCVYCCLNANLKEFKDMGFKYDLGVKPEAAAETYRAACAEVGTIRNVAFTGGSLQDTRKEIERYRSLYSALSKVREELGQKTHFGACVTAPPDRAALQGLRDAGLNSIAPNMDCWEEKLWPTIVPGKHKFVGRQFWIDAILMSLEVFDEGHVGTVFVSGPEMVAPGGFKSLEEGVESWARCFDWCLSHRIYPSHVVWQTEVGSPWADKEPPPTEYFLAVDQERHKLMVKYDLDKTFYHYYFRAQAWQTGCDWRRLVDHCQCENCR